MGVAVITGAGAGIGAVIAQHAAKAGYTVELWDVDGGSVREVAAGIGEAATAREVDVSSEESVAAAFAALPAAPDLVVNNAGLVRFGPLKSLAVEDWRAVVEVNLVGTFLVARHAAVAMEPVGSGSIVNIASVNGIAAAPNAGAYTATKAAIIRLSEQMALEWGPSGIRVNCVAPGLIMAGMSDAIYADEEIRRLRQAAVPMGTLGTAEQVADCVLFLASPSASYITGQLVAVDGGLTKAGMLNLARPKSVDSVGQG